MKKTPNNKKLKTFSIRKKLSLVMVPLLLVSFVVTADKNQKIAIFFTRNAPKALRRRAERREI